MPIILLLLCVLAFLAGGGIFAVSISAIHEIEAFILFLISAVLLAGASAVSAINVAYKKIETKLREVQSSLSPPKQCDSVPAALPPTVSVQSPPTPEGKAVGLNKDSAGNSTEEEDARLLLAKAREFSQSGRREKAVTALQEVIRRYPRTIAGEKARRSLERIGIST